MPYILYLFHLTPKQIPSLWILFIDKTYFYIYLYQNVFYLKVGRVKTQEEEEETKIWINVNCLRSYYKSNKTVLVDHSEIWDLLKFVSK